MSVMRGNGLDDGEHSPIAESSGSEMDEQDEAMEDVQNSDFLDNDGVASCYAARFEIPDRDEDLLSRTTSSYVVKKENIPIDTAQTVIRRLASATEEEDYEKIYVYFDDLFHICRLDTTIRSWSIWLDLIRTLIELFKPFKQSVVNVLCHAVSAGENLPENLAEVCADRVEVLHMFVYLIQRLTFHIEGTVIKRAYEQLGTSAKECENRESNENDDLNENISEEGVVVWTDLRVEILKIIRFICYINIRRGNSDSVENAIRFLWRPAEPSTQMLRALAAIIVNFAAHPRFAETSSKPDLKELFEYLRPICVDFKLASEVARIIVKASVNFEYLNYRHVKEYPFVEIIRIVSKNGDMDQMMSHMLYYAAMLRPRESSLQCLPRPFALLIEKIAESAPETFFENVRGVVPFLEYDPPSMRSAILKAFSQVVCGPDMKPRYLRPGRDARIIRDIMTDQLQAHLADNNLQVRLDVLHYWITIAANRRLPCDSVRKGLYFAVVERLRDKSSPIRIDAMRLLVICVLFNVYGDKLDFESLSEIIRKLSAYKEQVEFVDPDRPGFFVVVDRFKSFEKKMRKMLELILENKLYEKDSDDLEDEPLESLLALLVDMIEISMKDALCILVKLLYLGRLETINVDIPRAQLIDALVREFERYYVSIHVSRIGDSFGEELLREMEVAYEENMDLVEHALSVTQERLLFAEQMTMMFPILIDALKQSDLVDKNFVAVSFCAACGTYQIRHWASALLEMYSLGNPALSAEVLSTVMKMFLKRNRKQELNIVGTANGLIATLSKPDMKDRYALNELLFLAFRREKVPLGLIHHLIRIINEVPSSFCQYPAMVVLSLFARVDPRGMREYLRDFQKCLRSSDVLVACEALHALSYLIPMNDDVSQEDEAYLYHLRAIDSLFPDIENFLFRVILSDDDTVDSQYWYVSMRYCVKAVFTLSADIDYMISRILGKAMWYAHRSAQLLVLYKEGNFTEISQECATARSEYWNIAWQRTTERLLMLIGEVIEGILVHVDNYFPKLLKRAMTLDEKAAEELEDATEPYADYNKDHSIIEMDFAYREGLFARTVTSIAKSKVEGGDITTPELNTEQEKPTDRIPNELGEDDSNRPSSEELIRTRTQALLQTRLLHKSGVVGHSLSLVVFFIRCSGIPDEIRNAALRAFSKFLLISPQLTERASPTLFTFICCHPNPQMKEYLLAASVDVMHRFPSILENKCLFLFEMPMDADPCVRITALLYLKYLLTHDMLKPRGTLSDTALCLLNRKRADANSEDSTNEEKEVAVLAMSLFLELSKKGNLLVNVLPDLICRICRCEEQVPLNAFKYIVRRLLPLVDDKPLDNVVEKMCQRFQFCNSGEATERNKHISHYFSYFISQLHLSDTSFYKMRDTLAYFAQFLEDETIYRDFMAVTSQLISNTQSADVKRDAEEMLRKIDFLHVRSSLTDEERDVMSRTVGPINLAVPVKLDRDGMPIMFSFADCDEPVDYDDK